MFVLVFIVIIPWDVHVDVLTTLNKATKETFGKNYVKRYLSYAFWTMVMVPIDAFGFYQVLYKSLVEGFEKWWRPIAEKRKGEQDKK